MEPVSQEMLEKVRGLVLGHSGVSSEQRLALVERALETGVFVRKSSNKIVSIDRDAFEITFDVTTDTVDRDDERVLPRAFEKTIGSYLENPVVLFGHNHQLPAVARMVSHKFTDEAFSARDKFAAEETEMGAMLWRLYSAEPPFMRAVSIGFLPLDWTMDKDRKLPNQGGRTYLQAEAIEHSLVNVGSNRSALSKMWKSVKDSAIRKVLEAVIEQPTRGACGHSTVYDEKGEALDPCLYCVGAETMSASDTASEIATMFDEFEKENGVTVPKRPEGYPFCPAVGTTDVHLSTPSASPEDRESSENPHLPPEYRERIEASAAELKPDLADLNRPQRKFFGFTLVGSRERDRVDIWRALDDFKTTVLGLNAFDMLDLVATFDADAICFSWDLSRFYRVDWERDDDGDIVLDNAVEVELQAGETQAINLGTTRSTNDLDSDEAPTEATLEPIPIEAEVSPEFTALISAATEHKQSLSQ